MYTIEELWNSFASLNELRQDWANNEGINNPVHELLDKSCQVIYDNLVERFQQIHQFGPCCGCVADGPDGSFVMREWHCGGVYRDNIINQVYGQFYCKSCGCRIAVNAKGEDPFHVFRTRNLSPL